MTKSNGQGGSAPSLLARKAALRTEALARLARCDPAAAPAIAGRITAPAGATVAVFYPMGNEVPLAPLLRDRWAGTRTLALPRTPRRGQPLSFHRWADGDALEAERFGTFTSTGPAVRPELLLVPLLAFDRQGRRLGYGGGFYDRTLLALPGVPAIGIAYAALEVAAVPAGPHDVPLGAVATERELIRCASSF